MSGFVEQSAEIGFIWFTLKFRLPNANAHPEQFIYALAEAGCDDTTF